MKTIRIIILISLFGMALSIHAQIKHKYDGIWWDIADTCFAKANLSEQTCLFIEVNNPHSAGSIFKRRLNSTGRMLHPIVLFNYKEVVKNIPDFPKINTSQISTNEAFTLKQEKVYQTEVVGKILQVAYLNKKFPELYNLLLQQKASTLKFINWGTEIIDKQAVEQSLSDNKKLDFVKETRDGERYIVLESVWVKTLQIS